MPSADLSIHKELKTSSLQVSMLTYIYTVYTAYAHPSLPTALPSFSTHWFQPIWITVPFSLVSPSNPSMNSSQSRTLQTMFQSYFSHSSTTPMAPLQIHPLLNCPPHFQGSPSPQIPPNTHATVINLDRKIIELIYYLILNALLTFIHSSSIATISLDAVLTRCSC